VKNGENHLNGGDSLGWVNRNRDTAAVVLYADPAILGDGHVDHRTVAGQGLVYGVIHNLIDQVVKTTRSGGTDVHAGTFTNRFEALEDLDIASFVVSVFRRRHIQLKLLVNGLGPVNCPPDDGTYIRVV
jgi:hypothetical protein